MKRLAVLLLGAGCMNLSVSAVTIDRMYTATFGHYSQSYTAGGQFMLFSSADYYQLSDGSTWDSGAGSHPATYSTLSAVSVDGNQITYTFDAPASGLLFRNTDYNAGSHSAQGELGLPGAAQHHRRTGRYDRCHVGLYRDPLQRGDLLRGAAL